jgi:uncharacterized protein YqfA (UPF0365 family)
MQDPRSLVALLVGALVFAVLVIGLILFFSIFQHWMRAVMSGGRVTIFDILGMRIRGSPPSLLIDAYSALRARDVNVSIGKVERVYIANKGRIQTADDLADLVQGGG